MNALRSSDNNSSAGSFTSHGAPGLSQGKIAGLNYRPDIDGLRAVAVLGVVLCHAGLGFTGGFVGVDVFFVISGYLITRLILKDLQDGTFSLLRFWDRRVRRIVPALVVVTVVTLVAGWFIIEPIGYAKLGKSVVGLVLILSNVQFWKDTNYFGGVANQKPLLHTWSLAVEEQFYLVLPFLLLALARIRRLSCSYALLVTLALLSFLLSVYGTRYHTRPTFYLLPTRAWELSAGVLIAIRPAAWITASPRRGEILAILGIALIILPMVLYSNGTTFPGLAALPPVAGATLLISSGSMPRRSPLINRLLAWRLPVFIGLVSYSLYLWHWPVLVFARLLTIHKLWAYERFLLVLASAVIAILSWQFIEVPYRTRRWLVSRSHLFAFTGLASGVLLSSGLVLWRCQGLEYRVPPQARLFSSTSTQETRFNQNLEISERIGSLIHLGKAGTEPELLVWGDSHAWSILPAIDSLCLEANIAGCAATRAMTAPFLGDFYTRRLRGQNQQAAEFNRAVWDYIKNRRIKYVVMVGLWKTHFDQGIDNAVLETIDTLRKQGIDTSFVFDVPNFEYNVPQVLVLYSTYGWDPSHLEMAARDYYASHTYRTVLQPQLMARCVRILDPIPFLWPDRSPVAFRPFDSAGSFYYDGDHLSSYGALRLKPMFAPLFEHIAKSRGQSNAPLLDSGGVDISVTQQSRAKTKPLRLDVEHGHRDVTSE